MEGLLLRSGVAKEAAIEMCPGLGTPAVGPGNAEKEGKNERGT